ncbi:MAG: GGDEF domain-containing protein [Sphingomonadales bacterium]|nr:GGDEF domain-containing protein [Sphingomonadales bacterium]
MRTKLSQQDQAGALEINLIRSVYEVAPIAVAMTLTIFSATALAAWTARDTNLLLLLICFGTASIARIAVLLLHFREARRPGLSLERARRLQRRFALVHFAFAFALGMFSRRVLQLPLPELHMLIVCIVMGYAAGMASGVSLRPTISVTNMVLVTAPVIWAALLGPSIAYWATALLISAFLVCGAFFVRARHARAAENIARQLAFSTLALHDGLTSLPNRLALREWFDEHVTYAKSPGVIAVHFLDLDGFKPVNDRFGHSVGDALLVAVGMRIARTIRSTDTAARLGGDEFAILQCGIADPEDATLLAERLAAAIARPFSIESHTIEISTCVGYVVAEHGAEDLECLLSLADEALYACKRSGGGIKRWEPDLGDPEYAAA